MKKEKSKKKKKAKKSKMLALLNFSCVVTGVLDWSLYRYI
jgi:hypothetical protein